VYIYKWKDAIKAIDHASLEELESLPRLKLKKNQKIRPGISSFADRPDDIGPEHLQSLIDVALKEIPPKKVPDTPVFLMATAGMRLLPQAQQVAILDEICAYLQENTGFLLPDCDSHIQVISGETEGIYGWLAANYLLGGFDDAKHHNHGKGHHTYGFLDMGGASAQIAFAPNATEAERHANDLKLVRLRNLDGSRQEYRVFSATFLGFGVDQARHRYIERLEDLYGAAGDGDLPDPCMPRGLRTTIDGDFTSATEPTHGNITLTGTGRFSECLRQTYPLLGKDAICVDSPCLLNGQHVPAIDFDVNHFVGVSEYWHATHGVFEKDKKKAYDVATYQKAVADYCSQEWDDITAKLEGGKHKGPEQKAKDAQEACFKASWLINVLYDGIGIPRIDLDASPTLGVNVSNSAAGKVQAHGFADPFRPVDSIDGIEVSWTLGKMLLYAAGQVPPKGSTLPVGFGSNQAGIPPDFEYAGSTDQTLGIGLDDDDDDTWGETADELMGKARSNATATLFGVFVVILIAGFLLLRRDRRPRICGRIRTGGRRRRAQRKGWGFSLASIFGRNSTVYERVLEEGLADEFELGGQDSDDSDDSEPSRTAKSSGLLTPTIAGDRADDGRFGPVMDRSGLAVRTESRERLAPSSIQMLNAGRRSRAGSPTRLKSAPMKPLRED